MKIIFAASLIFGFAILFVGCDKKGEPIAFDNACKLANEKKTVEMSGFLNDHGGIFCSNIGGGDVRCGVDLTETLNAEKGIKSDIVQGSSSNEIEKMPSGYKKEDIKIRDNGGNLIDLSQKVKITGEMNVLPDESMCFIEVSKIER